jgi:hypothetical protein
MDRSLTTAIAQIDLCLARVRLDLEAGNRSEALEHCAELFEHTRRLWSYLAELEGYSCVEAQVRLTAGGNN